MSLLHRLFGLRRRQEALSSAVGPVIEALEPKRLLTTPLIANVTVTDPVRVDVAYEAANVRTKVTFTNLVTMAVNVEYESGADPIITVNGNVGNDYIVIDDTFPGAATINGGDGNDTIIGGLSSDSLTGGLGNDRIEGRTGSDFMEGAGGADTLIGGSGADVFSGGNGTDVADYTGSAAALTIDIDGNADDGASGEADNVTGNIEIVWGGSGSDTITGSDNNETLVGNNGNDVLTGGLGNDLIEGGNHGDTLEGAGGADTLRGNSGSDLFSGGNGIDVADYSGYTSNVAVSIDGNANDGASGEGDNVTGNVENLLGGSGNDTLVGSTGDNTIDGGAGADSISGGDGVDVLYGGLGNDTLIGGNGADSMYGNDGDDLFYAADGYADYLDGGPGTGDSAASYDSLLDTLTRM